SDPAVNIPVTTGAFASVPSNSILGTNNAGTNNAGTNNPVMDKTVTKTKVPDNPVANNSFNRVAPSSRTTPPAKELTPSKSQPSALVPASLPKVNASNVNAPSTPSNPIPAIASTSNTDPNEGGAAVPE